MPGCLNHPEVSTPRRCALCEEPLCDACLEPFPAIGRVCSDCERVLAEVPRETLPDQLSTLKAKVKASIPESRPWWAWHLLFWCVTLVPTLVLGLLVQDLFQYHQYMAFVSREPSLPGLATAQLTQVAAALEAQRNDSGAYPSDLTSLPALPDAALLQDVYSLKGQQLLYRMGSEGYVLCSRGPDRRRGPGPTLDRFTGIGDLCIIGPSSPPPDQSG